MGIDFDSGSVVGRRRVVHSRHGPSASPRLLRPNKVVAARDRDRSRDRSRSRVREQTRSRSRAGSRTGSWARSRSRARSFFGVEERPASRNSNKSRKNSIFSLPAHSLFGGGPSYYRRSPRSSFLHRTYRKLRRLLRDLVYYAKRHPWKVFVLAVLPLLTGGVLTALLDRFGVRLPASVRKLLGYSARAAQAGGESVGLVGDAVRMTSVERARDGSLRLERRHAERDYFGGAAPSSRRAAGPAGTYYGYAEPPKSSHDDSWGAALSRFFS